MLTAPDITIKSLGITLLISVFIPLVILIIFSKGDFSGFQASMKGIEGVGKSANFLNKSFGAGIITQALTSIVAYGMLTIILRQNGDNYVSILALILMIISLIFAFLQGSFHSSVTVWAANELAEKGSVPDMFHPLWKWMYSTVQMTYVYFGLLATAAYGWSIINTNAFPTWLGWTLIVWAIGWLIFFLIMGDNLPLVLWISPIIIGITALLL